MTGLWQWVPAEEALSPATRVTRTEPEGRVIELAASGEIVHAWCPSAALAREIALDLAFTASDETRPPNATERPARCGLGVARSRTVIIDPRPDRLAAEARRTEGRYEARRDGRMQIAVCQSFAMYDDARWGRLGSETAGGAATWALIEKAEPSLVIVTPDTDWIYAGASQRARNGEDRGFRAALAERAQALGATLVLFSRTHIPRRQTLEIEHAANGDDTEVRWTGREGPCRWRFARS